MNNAIVGIVMISMMGLMPYSAFSDETVPFPFWQHGFSIQGFWSIVNAGTQPATVTLTLFDSATGSFLVSATSTISAAPA
ncbi:hypothetical protein JXA80_10210 [bacterium]|nr:hypothetical protein [candidate division CSSED10-310 bacterium]